MTRAMTRTAKIVWWGVLIVGLAIAAAVIINRQTIVDWYRGMRYAPTAEMAAIQENLELTEAGEFLFKALAPSLAEDEAFNAVCHQEASETAVLGCYAGGAVYVHQVTAPELEGILEVTTAHEMLHAVWARMNGAEQERLRADLEAVLTENGEALAAELETYGEDARLEEVYVRAGTEIKDLPEGLEQHFARYFNNRGRIVDFYHNYIAVFNEKKEQAQQLQAEIPSLKEQIEADIAQYEAAASELERKIEDFNACAATVACFSGQAEFATQRAQILDEQQRLQTENARLNEAIASYNAKIDQYNQVVDDSRKLEAEINSNSLTEVDF